MLGGIEDFRFNFLLITHFLITMYVGIDAIIAIKLTYLSLIGYFFIVCIDLLYEGSRPFWTSSQIAGAYCLRSYGHPSRDVFVTLFIVFFTIKSFGKKIYNKSYMQNTSNKKMLIIQAGAVVLLLAYFFQKYIIGLAFLISIAIGILYFILYFFCIIFMDNYLDSLIRKSSITSMDAKKYVFYWFLWLLLAEVLAIILYSGS